MASKRSIAVIPARGGSKRIPGKNARPFLGKPMLHYSIDAAKRSGLFETVLVSTDSEEIAEVARQGGADVPFLRPPKISDDFTPLADVVHHALRWMKDNKQKEYDYACCILATAPFIQTKYLVEGFNKLVKEGVSTVIPVTSFEYPIWRSFKIESDGVLKMNWPEHEYKRSNDLPETYHDIGQFYWLEVSRFLKQNRLFTPDAKGVVIPRHLVQDIDTPEDWKRAEIMYQTMLANKELERVG